jgi:hypothetical protein
MGIKNTELDTDFESIEKDEKIMQKVINEKETEKWNFLLLL